MPSSERKKCFKKENWDIASSCDETVICKKLLRDAKKVVPSESAEGGSAFL